MEPSYRPAIVHRTTRSTGDHESGAHGYHCIFMLHNVRYRHVVALSPTSGLSRAGPVNRLWFLGAARHHRLRESAVIGKRRRYSRDRINEVTLELKSGCERSTRVITCSCRNLWKWVNLRQ